MENKEEMQHVKSFKGVDVDKWIREVRGDVDEWIEENESKMFDKDKVQVIEAYNKVFVSFNVAFLLKEFGYDNYEKAYYTTEPENSFIEMSHNVCSNSSSNKKNAIAPTIEDAIRFVRNEFNYHIFTTCSYAKKDPSKSWWFGIADLEALTADSGLHLSENDFLYETPEEALNAGLKFFLETNRNQ